MSPSAPGFKCAAPWPGLSWRAPNSNRCAFCSVTMTVISRRGWLRSPTPSALGEITVVAPERDRSGASNSLTLDRPLSVRARRERFPLCERHADRLCAPCRHRPARCLAGHGGLGHQPRREHGRRHDLFGHRCGGHRRFPARHSVDRRVACQQSRRRNFAAAARVAADLVRAVQRQSRRAGDCSTSTCPMFPWTALAGSKSRALASATRPSRWCKSRDAARGHGVLGRCGRRRGDAGQGTDFHAVASGRVSVTPLQMDLTHFSQLERVRAWITE